MLPSTTIMAPLVEVKEVSFKYGHLQVLERVSLTIEPGDFLAIIGPNGSGKSTLIKIILGLLEPTEGEVFLFGQDLRHFHDWYRLGYVPQKAAHMIDPVFPLTVEEAVSLGLLSRKRFPRLIGRADRPAIKKALETVEMAPHGERRISELSGGQQQRVLIARAIVSAPDILFLDEPTAGVDARGQDRFYGLLNQLNQKGLTIVMVTHDISVVSRFVTKVACLNRRLYFHGSHEEFCSSPRIRELIAGEDHIIVHRH
ncbi:metal ABC transporter ATP-binding protein [Thermosulfuriphilus ammonigenes]|nr:metal ABC transporter ATP-binding protein [Thermosulfuriphilus ammonigenes]